MGKGDRDGGEEFSNKKKTICREIVLKKHLSQNKTYGLIDTLIMIRINELYLFIPRIIEENASN